MPRLVSDTYEKYLSWVGRSWTCPNTGKTWEVTRDDILNMKTITVGHPLDEDFRQVIPCPCGRAHVYMDSHQYEGSYLVHY
jgi:hypothetical protein